MLIRSILLILFTVVVQNQSHALVDMNNAGYSNTYLDLEVPGSGYPLRVFRAYKSRTIFNGMFGFGWCSEFETKLSITGLGLPKINECGDGQQVLYSAREITKKDVEAIGKQIITKMKADKRFQGRNDDFWKRIEQQIMTEDVERDRYAAQVGVSMAIKENVKYMANGTEVEFVTFKSGVYTRNLPDGSYQRFDKDGKITHFYDKNGNFIKFEYDKAGLLSQVEDNNQRKLNFKFFPNKKVRQITGPNGLVTEYKYDQQENLVWNMNAWAKKPTDIYTYEYNEFHNMTKTTFPNKKSIEIKYDNVRDWVVQFVDMDKCVEAYKYEFSKDEPKFNYWSSVTKTCGKQVVASNRYEFWHKQLPNGRVVLSRVQTKIDGNIRDVTYHDVFGKPVTIKNNTDRVDYEYFADGLVKLKQTSFSRIDYTWEPKTKKVSNVKTSILNDKGKSVATRTTSFQYDGKGNLVGAENSDGQKVIMTYDAAGRIATITDQAKKIVKIDYDDRMGKPVVVTRPGLGSMRVSYKTTGEISKIDSKEGPTVASQIASTFNNLLDIIAPATQELYL